MGGWVNGEGSQIRNQRLERAVTADRERGVQTPQDCLSVLLLLLSPYALLALLVPSLRVLPCRVL